MKKKILWLSRHQPLLQQREELQRLYGSDVSIVVDERPFSSAEEISQRFRDGGYDEIVVVAPLSVIAKLVGLGIKPLWAEMQAIEKPAQPDLASETEANGRWYRFIRFRRVKDVQILFEDL